VRELANPAVVLTVSARRPDSLQAWFDWLQKTLTARREGASITPRIEADGAALHADR
jgi:hypothetical protein